MTRFAKSMARDAAGYVPVTAEEPRRVLDSIPVHLAVAFANGLALAVWLVGWPL